jgi:hypothetical protein
LEPRRWNSTHDGDEKSKEDKLFYYKAPMGALISRLKIVSITSCALSLVGLPMFIFLKNGALPNMNQLGMGGIALFGASGSTLALHFVFGPYALTMEEVPASSLKVTEGDANNSEDSTIIKATTRSVFGWTSEHLFDLAKDVMPYSGGRPFANFMANDIVLYAHPELLDEQMRQKLLFPEGMPEAETTEDPRTSKDEKNEGLSQSRKKKDDDDDFF